MIRILLLACVGCSSLVSDPCADGYVLTDGACVARTAMPPPVPHERALPAPGISPDPLPVVATTCVADLDNDASNCGHCDHVCGSGICTLGHCVGDVPGHVVAIGHDYASSDGAMDRVIGNACGLAAGPSVRIGWYRGSAPQQDGVDAAARGLAQTGRTVTSVTMSGVADSSDFEALDAVVIEPQLGDGDAAQADGAAARSALGGFLAAGHAVVVLETVGGVSYRFAAGADLATLAPPVDASRTPVDVAIPADGVAIGVPTPYMAKAASVGYPGAADAVVVDRSGNAVVVHATY